ncbi:bactofilin family protein [Natronorubrum aibiense]|uniref:Cell shape determination protein CcmA n=1 Tax=Natronorubrum aibiense TaxID=348826 RepID=A0A5P9P2C9_9EURY|nr:cell shape determination protein CcmA [Natronorubrum aibiense]QFU82186.1 cell shape determination protein CcmA [Natronorubrum aibiense]
MDRNQRLRTVVVIAVIALVLAGTVPATVAAQSDARTGGTIVVDEGETVDELEAFGGSIVVRGTVTGDVSAAGGDVVIEDGGEVGGTLEVASGSVTIAGVVDGDVDVGAGSLTVAESGTIGGDLRAGVGSATIDGTIEGDAEIGAETIRLGEGASIAGDLRYDGNLEGNTDAVAGTIEQDSSLGISTTPTIPTFAPWVFAAYAFAVNLLLGAVLLALFPRFSGNVAARVSTGPLRTGLVGLGVFVGVPILLIALLITVIGIPLSVIGAFVFALLLWIGAVYGWFAVAAALLSAVGIGNRWLALVVGLAVGTALSRAPFVGGLITLIVLLLGLGAIARALYGHRRSVRERDRRVGAGSDGPTTD